MGDLPSGGVTFMFSDLEGSTRLLERHGSSLGPALAWHHNLFGEVVERAGGTIFETVGDAVYAVFAEPFRALEAAGAAHQRLAAEDWEPVGPLRARIAIDTGQVERRGSHYFGPALFRCARLQALAHGQQTLLSATTAHLVRGQLRDGLRLRDLGRHRLKDLDEPEHVFQLLAPGLPSDFPALRSLESHPTNLPLQLTSFVARRDELARIDQLLAEGRLVTLTGTGGTGKTRLALEAAARRLERHPDGVFLVDLSAVRDAEDVPRVIGATLSVRTEPGQDALDALGQFLADRALLLVIDNFEQVIAGAVCIGRLLEGSPQLHVLATSRTALHLRGERELNVGPLSTGVRGEYGPAVELFLAPRRRGQPARPGR